MFDIDEEQARSRDIGVTAHAAIATLAARTRTPSPLDYPQAVKAALQKYPASERLAHRQNAAGLVAAYFWHLLPPPGWTFAGSELRLGAGRVDLLWRNDVGLILLDEIKAAPARNLILPTTVAQVDRYCQTGRGIWGERFIGVRLLSLRDWRQSLFVTPTGERQPLHTTRYGS